MGLGFNGMVGLPASITTISFGVSGSRDDGFRICVHFVTRVEAEAETLYYRGLNSCQYYFGGSLIIIIVE